MSDLSENNNCLKRKLTMENKVLRWAIMVVLVNAIALFVAGGAWYVLNDDVERLKVESAMTKEKIDTIEKNVWKIIHRMGIE